MSTSDFRQIAIRRQAGKAERLFRAAVSAYCALTRPSRREITQLDDLTLPLFDEVSPEGRRFAAAALSECESAPPGLVKRLANEAVEISAPLLIRSRTLNDVELLALIGRHGLPHARAIGRRKNLHPAITSLIRALDRSSPPSTLKKRTDGKQVADKTRSHLRSMMADGPQQSFSVMPATPQIFSNLLDAALDMDGTLFHSALACALNVAPEIADRIASSSESLSLLAALRALDLKEAEAFLILNAALPGSFPDIGSVRLFIKRYRALSSSAAMAKIGSLITDSSERSTTTQSLRAS